MREIKVKRILCVSNQVEKHGAANLLPGDIDKKRNWLCEEGTPKGIVILELECRTVITAVRIGNAHSAFVEVLVGNIGDPTDKYRTLIPSCMFMSYEDSQAGTNPGQVKFFYQKDFCKNVASKEWQVIQIVCSQPYNKKVPFGICFIRVNGLGDDLVIVPEKKEQEKTGPAPVLKEKEPEETKLTIAEEILKAVNSSSKKKATAIKLRSSCSKHKEKQNHSEDFRDNRRNKDIGLEESPTKKVMEEHKGGSSSEGTTKERVEKNDRKTVQGQKKRDERSGCSQSFSRLMEDVFFTISGIENPERGDIRNKALQMGATYFPDWRSQCTHLICSYQNTPKYKQVKGKGKIVKKGWIEASYKDKKRYPWRRFALDSDERNIEESEEEILAVDGDTSDEDEEDFERAGPSSSTVAEKKKRRRVDADMTDTDEEEISKNDTTDYPMPHLPDLFSNKVFHVDQELDDCALIEKYIIAYNGRTSDEINGTVDFYITETGGTSLLIMREKAPKMKAVRPAWIWEMCSASQWISPWKFMLSI